MRLSFIFKNDVSTICNVAGEVTCIGRSVDEMNEALVAE